MKIASILENQEFEKRIAITPEIAKKYTLAAAIITTSGLFSASKLSTLL